MNSRWIDAGGVVCARERVAHSELHLGWLGLPAGVAAGGEWCEPPIRLVLFEAGAADVDWRRGIIAGIHHRRVSMLRRRSFFPQEAENFSEQRRRWQRGAHQSNASRLIPTSIAHNFFGFFFVPPRNANYAVPSLPPTLFLPTPPASIVYLFGHKFLFEIDKKAIVEGKIHTKHIGAWMLPSMLGVPKSYG